MIRAAQQSMLVMAQKTQVLQLQITLPIKQQTANSEKVFLINIAA